MAQQTSYDYGECLDTLYERCIQCEEGLFVITISHQPVDVVMFMVRVTMQMHETR